MRHPQSHSAAAGPTLEAIKVTSLPSLGSTAVAYMVLSPTAESPSDKRKERRWRTHLRSGRIVDEHARIITESQVRDRSTRGMRLKLIANVQLPERIRFFDDISKRLIEAVIAWRRGRDTGLKLMREVDPGELTRAELFKLGIKLNSADCRKRST